VPRVRAWAEAHPGAAAAWNVLGWLLGVAGDDLEGGKAALERALRGHFHYGDARLNLARIFVKLQAWRHASVELEAAVRSRNCWRPHEAWTRLGEVRVAQGQLRRALGAFRRAQEVDAKGEYTRQLFDAVNALTHVLHQHRRFILHVFDETARNQAFEARAPSTLAPEPLSVLARRAHELRSVVREPAHAALDCIEEQATQRALLPRWSDQSATFDLEQHGGEEGRALGVAWRGALFELYEELLEREEPGFDDDAPLAAARKAAAERRWDDALTALRKSARVHPEFLVPEVVADLGERWGDRLVFLDEPERAKDFYAAAFEGAQLFASWATSGAEALGRSAEVERLRKKRSG
jgi:tetratricopeptide (TPR) repeat protein